MGNTPNKTWETYGKNLVNLWEKNMGNMAKKERHGKHMGNIWKKTWNTLEIYGKMGTIWKKTWETYGKKH